MPELPTYTSQKAIQGLQPSDRGIESFEMEGRHIGATFRELGASIEGAFNTIQEHQQNQDAVDFTNQSTDFNIDMEKKWKAASAQGTTAEDFLQNTYEPGSQGLLDGMRTDKGRQAASIAIARQRGEFAQRIYGEEAAGDARKAQLSLQNSGDTYANEAHDAPENAAAFTDAWQHSAAFVAGAAQLTPAQREEILAQGRDHIYTSAADGLLNQYETNPNPTSAQRDAITSILQSDEYRRNLSPKSYAEAVDRLNKASKLQQDVQGTIAAQALPDVFKQIELTGDPDGKLSVTARSLIAGDTKGEPDTVAVRQAERERQLQDALAVGQASRAISDKSDAAALAALPGLRTQMSGATADQLGPLQRASDAIVTAVKRRDEGIKTQGAQFFLDNPALYSTVGAQFQKFLKTNDPKDFQAYARTVATLETTIDPKNPVRILPRALYDDVAGKIGNATNNPEGAGVVAQTLSDLRTLTGSYWNGVAHELQANGVLKSSQFAAAQLIGDPRSWSLAQEVIRASVTPDADLTLASGKPRGAADQLAAKALKDLSGTFAETANGRELVDSYVHAISDVMRARGTVDATTAANLAQTMVLDRFNIRNNLRIPKQFDDADVADGAANVMAHIDQHDIQPPPSFSGMKGATQGRAYMEDVRDYGHWITNERGDGAYLRDQFGSPVYERKSDESVVPVEVPFADLERIGKGIRSPLNQAGRFFTNPASLPPGSLDRILP